ncbi:MAG: hypothetical protein K2X49_15805 [Acetobacteraceae bacterium]|nr:hypothetical protein [Acetobacteraceae bacterium]
MSDRSGSPSPERKTEIAARDTFPASDAPAVGGADSVRAVPVERMLRDEGGMPDGTPAGAATLTQAFPDAEAAKLALEQLVREGPLDRRCAAIRPGAAGAELVLTVPPADRGRLEALLRRQAMPMASG